MSFSATHLQVQDLGRMSYANALQMQRQVHQEVLDGTKSPTVLLVEHDPVITISQRRHVKEHLLVDSQQLAHMGIDVQSTDRGGDVTYHGPGQLVAYPIVRLSPLGLNVGRYMRLLEQIVLDTVAHWGVLAHREPGLTGVWARDAVSTPDRIPTGSDELNEPPIRKGQTPFGGETGTGTNFLQKIELGPNQPVAGFSECSAKLCAMGIRVRRDVTMHGLALNVTTNLDHFAAIVPCGLAGRGVTSLVQLLGCQTPPMEDVKSQLFASMQHRLSSTSGRCELVGAI